MKKIKKTKTGLIATLGFAAVALLSVGFSAWVVNIDSSVDTGNVTVEVADTDTNEVTFGEPNVTDATFGFDAAPGDIKGPIVSSTGVADPENMSVSFEFTYTPTGTFNGITLKPIASETEGAVTIGDSDFHLDDYISSTKNYLMFGFALDGSNTDVVTIVSSAHEAVNKTVTVTPTGSSEAETKTLIAVTVGAANTEGTREVTVVLYFHWGSAFNYKNPSEYATDTNVETVKTALTALKSANGNKFALQLAHTY